MTPTLTKFCLYGQLLMALDPEVREPAADTLFLLHNLEVAAGQRVLVLGAGAGLLALEAARKGCTVVATDILEKSVSLTRRNATINGLEGRLTARAGDLYAPLPGGQRFDVIVANPPQLPTPPELERADWIGHANNGGPTGRLLIERIIRGLNDRLESGGRAYLLVLSFVGVEKTLELIRASGMAASVRTTSAPVVGALSFERQTYLLGPGVPRSYRLVVVVAERTG
jgi:release factor glutamine methyltransferase